MEEINRVSDGIDRKGAVAFFAFDLICYLNLHHNRKKSRCFLNG